MELKGDDGPLYHRLFHLIKIRLSFLNSLFRKYCEYEVVISVEPSVGGDELNASVLDDLDDSVDVLLLVDCLNVAV